MKSLIILSLITLAIFLPYINSEVVCPDDTACPSRNTCCRNSRGGYGCCSHIQAQCCQDRIHCCPQNTTCDVSSDKCLQKGLFKLEYYNMMKIPISQPFAKNIPALESKSPKLTTNTPIDDIIAIISSFLNTINLSHISTLLTKDEELIKQIQESLVVIINDVKSGNKEQALSDIKVFAALVEKTIVFNLDTVTSEDTKQEMRSVIEKFKDLRDNFDKYKNIVEGNISKNYFQLIMKVAVIKSEYDVKNWSIVGIRVAELFQMLFKIELKQLHLTFLATKVSEPQMTPECEQLMKDYMEKVKEFYKTKSIIWNYSEFQSLLLEFQSIKQKCD